MKCISVMNRIPLIGLFTWVFFLACFSCENFGCMGEKGELPPCLILATAAFWVGQWWSLGKDTVSLSKTES